MPSCVCTADSPPFDATNQLALAKKISAGKFSRIPDEYSEDLFQVIRWMYAAKMKELFSIQEDLQKQEALLLVRETQLHGN
ncbi:hypothetical protein DYB35_007622, partial [Aphanomyces astaci]